MKGEPVRKDQLKLIVEGAEILSPSIPERMAEELLELRETVSKLQEAKCQIHGAGCPFELGGCVDD